MNPKANMQLVLHSATRRYCMQRHAYWSERYAEICRKGRDRENDGFHYTEEALLTFPRYNIMNAILVEIEKINTANLDNLDEVRSLLILAGEVAEDDFTKKPIGPVDKRAIAEERAIYCEYVKGLSLSDLAEEEILPSRRVLQENEAKALWLQLRRRWQIPEGYWYPLADCNLPDVLAFQEKLFDQKIQSDQLRALLDSHNVKEVYELREYGPEYVEDVSLLEPFYNGAEGFWFSKEMDWIIYASHESSITVGGWLIAELKEIVPEWKEYIWEYPCY